MLTGKRTKKCPRITQRGHKPLTRQEENTGGSVAVFEFFWQIFGGAMNMVVRKLGYTWFFGVGWGIFAIEMGVSFGSRLGVFWGY